MCNVFGLLLVAQLVVPEGPGMLPIPDDLAVPTGVAVKVVATSWVEILAVAALVILVAPENIQQ